MVRSLCGFKWEGIVSGFLWRGWVNYVLFRVLA